MCWLWLSLLVIVFDLGSKYLADSLLTYASPVPLLPVFDLTLLYNTGAAFSFLAGAGGWQRWLFVAIAMGMSAFLLHWMYRTPGHITCWAWDWRWCWVVLWATFMIVQCMVM